MGEGFVFCEHCGAKIGKDALICPNCGYATGDQGQVRHQEEDIPSGGMNALSFFIPIIGIILYFSYRKETPVKAGGKLFIIDGGISKAYHKTTGIAGYTAIMTSKHMYLAEHQPYEPLQPDGTQVFHKPIMHLEHTVPDRLLIRDTDNGAELREQIKNLEALYDEFVGGGIREIY